VVVDFTDARIHDIHLESNLVERRLGLARVHMQNASGQVSAETTIDTGQDVE
jgi:putative membrane protein